MASVESEKPHPQPPLDDEPALLEALRQGEPAAYERLMRKYGNRVLATARHMLGSSEDAADVFQETFVQVYRGIGSFEGRSALWYWIRGIAVNQSLMRLRQRKRRREDSIETLLPSYDGAGHRLEPVDKRTPEHLLEGQDVCEYVRTAVDELPDAYRTIIVLRDFQGYSTREAAQMLGIEPNAAKVRLHRARAALKTMLEPVTRRTDFL